MASLFNVTFFPLDLSLIIGSLSVSLSLSSSCSSSGNVGGQPKSSISRFNLSAQAYKWTLLAILILLWSFRLYRLFLVLSTFISKAFSIFTKLCSKSWYLHSHYNTQKWRTTNTALTQTVYKEWLRLICVPIGTTTWTWKYIVCKIRGGILRNMRILKNEDNKATYEGGQFTPDIPEWAGLCENGWSLKMNMIHHCVQCGWK